MKNLHTFDEFLNESELNEGYERPYAVEHKIGDEIELPVLGKCKVVEVGFVPKKTYSNPWICSGKDFSSFEPIKAFLKTTHKPHSIGSNAIQLETMDRYKDPIIMYQYQENNKVYTQYAYMT